MTKWLNCFIVTWLHWADWAYKSTRVKIMLFGTSDLAGGISHAKVIPITKKGTLAIRPLTTSFWNNNDCSPSIYPIGNTAM